MNIVKIYANFYLREKKIKDLYTQKLVIEFADKIDKMLEDAEGEHEKKN